MNKNYERQQDLMNTESDDDDQEENEEEPTLGSSNLGNGGKSPFDGF